MSDTPLADHWAWGRALRFADGPDEVHLQAIARMEIKDGEPGSTAAYLTPPLRGVSVAPRCAGPWTNGRTP